MPTPRKDETRDEFMERCIPQVLEDDTAEDNDQAVAVCSSIWRNRNKEVENTMDESKMYEKRFPFELKELDEKDRTVTVIGSKEVVDRSGDIVMVKGVDLKNWKKNPVVFFSHNHYDFPIAKGVGRKAWVEKDELLFRIQFATEEENPMAERAFKLYKGGYLKGVSMGFIPDYEKIEYPEKHKKGARRIFHQSELLEISVVGIPDNQDALMASINKAWNDGIFDGEDLSECEEVVKTVCTGKECETPSQDKGEATEDTFKKQLDEYKSELEEKEIKILELELQLKEQQMEEEIEDDIYTTLFGEFDQAGSSETETDTEHTDEMSLDDALNIITGDKE